MDLAHRGVILGNLISGYFSFHICKMGRESEAASSGDWQMSPCKSPGPRFSMLDVLSEHRFIMIPEKSERSKVSEKQKGCPENESWLIHQGLSIYAVEKNWLPLRVLGFQLRPLCWLLIYLLDRILHSIGMSFSGFDSFSIVMHTCHSYLNGACAWCL